jgi:hypothetical protein
VNERKTSLLVRSLRIFDLFKKSKKKGKIRCVKSRIELPLSSNAFLKKNKKNGMNISAIKGDL